MQGLKTHRTSVATIVLLCLAWLVAYGNGKILNIEPADNDRIKIDFHGIPNHQYELHSSGVVDTNVWPEVPHAANTVDPLTTSPISSNTSTVQSLFVEPAGPVGFYRLEDVTAP